MRPRTIGRRLALQYLFMADLNRYDGVEAPAEFFKTQRHALRDAVEEEPGLRFDRDDPKQDEAERFAVSLIREARDSREAIDAEIERAARNWTVARMGAIERNVIRLAAAELRLGVSPRGVVMDEAVELAKRFGDKDSGAFVNGVADRLGKDE